MATGLQDRFDWASVAVAGVVHGVGAATGGALRFGGKPWTIAGMANTAVSGAAAAIAGGASRSLIDGSDFGDNVLAALPDVIGATVGNAVAGRMMRSGGARRRMSGAPMRANTPML